MIVSNLNQYSVIHLPALQLSGYAFEGWSSALNSNGNDDEKQSTLYSIPAGQSAITLYGSWQPDPDTPAVIPTSGKGIDEAGSQSVDNVSGNSMTTYYMDEQGNRAQSVTLNSAPSQVIKTTLTIPYVPYEESLLPSLQNPLVLSLGENNGHLLALAGNQSAQNAPEITTLLPYNQSVDFISLPLVSGSAGLSTVAMKEINGVLSPIPCSLVKDNRLIVEISQQENLAVINNIKTFSDITSTMPQYGQNAASFVSSRGLMKGVGTSQSLFDPFGTLSRAQFAIILYRLAGEPSVEEFERPKDVAENLWYTNAARWCHGIGLMGQGSAFNGASPLSRQEFCVILYRIQKNAQQNINEAADGSKTLSANTSLLNGYGDGAQVSDWAREGMAWAIENQIIGQQSNLDPASFSNRINSAAMIERYLDNCYLGWQMSV